MEYPREIINKIISIGNRENYQKMEFINSRDIEGRLLWDHDKHYWETICSDLSKDETISLLKSLVYADGRYNNWSTYSVMHYSFYLLCILMEIYHLKPEEYENLLNWIFENRRNPYVPYIGANIPLEINSLEKYRLYNEACVEEEKKREEARKKEYEEAQLRKKKQKDRANQNRLENYAAQLKRKGGREKFLIELKSQNKIEVLRTIITDDKHSIDYYPDELSNVEEADIRKLTIDEKHKLISKLGGSVGSWRLLRNRLKQI